MFEILVGSFLTLIAMIMYTSAVWHHYGKTATFVWQSLLGCSFLFLVWFSTFMLQKISF